MVGAGGRRAGLVAFLASVSSAVAVALAGDAGSADDLTSDAVTSHVVTLDAGPSDGVVSVPADAGVVSPSADAAAVPPAPENDCCTASAAAGCNAPEVLACVCDGDEFCCGSEYDALCVTQAQTRCGLDCDLPPASSDCCSSSSEPGCTEPGVAACVCSVDPFCCSGRFDDNCVNLALSQCAATCPEAAP